MNFHDFWYVVAESHELRGETVLARQVLGEWLAVFRDADGAPVALQDRCKHRAGRLSRGAVSGGELRCPYHGWTYDAEGQVVAVPAEGDSYRRLASRCVRRYTTREQQGYVYVRLTDRPEAQAEPFSMPWFGEPGWRRVRLQNRFRNNVTNCVENFIDIPHTVWVHPGIFRTARGQRIDATVRRTGGAVHVEYRGETDNLGWFRRFLNPSGSPIEHSDHFYMPNVSTVHYGFGPRRAFQITSQSVPVTDTETLVYTDLSFQFGRLGRLAAPVVRFQGQRVIDQDLVALSEQMDVIERYGEEFSNTDADVIHVYVESIRKVLSRDGDPATLRDKTQEISFWV